MNRKIIILITLSLMLSLLSACEIPLFARRPKPAARMRITESKEISIPDATILDRSPDGRWLIVNTYSDPDNSLLCIYASEDLSRVVCIPEYDDKGITLQPVAWSPDSKKLALVEYMPNVPIDTDIWILNIETVHLEDITADGVSGILSVGMERTPVLDNAPTWSPDGIWIAFARTFFNDETLSDETALYKIPALGGDAERIAKVSDEPGVVQNGMLAWLADNRLIYTPLGERMDGGAIGLTGMPVAGEQPEQVLESLGKETVNSNLIAVSPDSTYALLLHEIESNLGTVTPLIQVFNLKTGESTPIKPPEPNVIPTWFSHGNWAAFAPDSSKIAYLYESKTPTAQWRLALVDIGSAEEVVLQTFDARKYDVNYPFRWGEDNTLMIRLMEEDSPSPIQLLTVK